MMTFVKKMHIFQTKVCNFEYDCMDGSDESVCPADFDFNDCEKLTGDVMCYWTEEKVDNLEWDIKTLNQTKEMPHGPKTGADDNTRFLFADWRSPPNGLPNMAVVRSPIYQDSAASCRLLLQTYIAGDINSSAIAVALKDGEIHTPIGFLHADSSTLSSFKDTEIQVGRHEKNLQVIFRIVMGPDI